MLGARKCHGGRNAARAVDVVVLDHHHVEERHAVVHPAAHAHGVLIEHAVAGQRFARIEDGCLGGGDGGGEHARYRGDARHPLEEVEGDALCCQQGRSRPANFRDDLAWHDLLSIGDVGNEVDGRVDAVEDGSGHRQPGDDAARFGGDAAMQHHVCVQCCVASRVTRPDVLGNGEFDERRGGGE